MHIGFRYHIASLVAVFFSLFLGILVGSILFQDDLLVKEQDNIIRELEIRFVELESSIHNLQGKLTEKNEKEKLLIDGWDQIRNIFIADKLPDRQVVFYRDKEFTDLTRLKVLIEKSGATVSGSFIWPQTFDEFLMQIDGLSICAEPKPMVIIWAESPFEDIMIEGINYFQELGWQLGLAQPFLSNIPLPNIASELLVVNVADTFIGELGLIQGLSNNLKGVYGYKNQAASLLPILDMEQYIKL